MSYTRQGQSIACLALWATIITAPRAYSLGDDFQAVYARMCASIQKLECFKATVSEQVEIPKRRSRKTTDIHYGGVGLFRISTRWDRSTSGIEKQIIASDGEAIVVMRRRRGRTEYNRYEIERMPRDRRPHVGVPKKMLPFTTPPKDLARFKLKGVKNAEDGKVARYECLEPRPGEEGRPILRSQRAIDNAVAKTVVWVGLSDYLPRRVETYNCRGELLNSKRYLSIAAKTDIPETTFRLDIPENAYCVDMTPRR